MLKELQICNYQSHRNTNISFSSGITGIIGESLSGKTPILRLIKWIVLNRPSGFRFHSHFAKKDKETSGQLTLDSGSKVTLSKIKKDAIYKLEVPGKKIQRFRKLKQGVPDLVKNELNIGDINFQDQLASHFLVTSSGGQIAKAISKITQVDKINSWVKTIKKKISFLKSKESILKSDIKMIDTQLKSFKGVNRLGRVIVKLDAICSKKCEAEAEYEKIDSLQIQIQNSYRAFRECKKYLKAKPYIVRLELVQRRLIACQQQEKLILDIKDMQGEIEQANIFKERYVKEYISIIKRQKICPTCFGKINSKIIMKIKKEIFRVK